MTGEQLFDKFEALTKGTLTEEEKTNLKQLIDNDADVKKQFIDYSIAVKAIQINRLADLKKEIHNSFQYQKHNNILLWAADFLSQPAAKAAVFVLLICSAALLYYILAPSGNMALYNKYFKVYEPAANSRSFEPEESSKRESIITIYNNKNYKQASIRLKEYLSSNKFDFEMRLLLASAYMKINNLNGAISELTTIIADTDDFYTTQAKWYLCLCYLAEGDLNSAKILLTEVKDKMGFNSSDAEKLLTELK